MCFAEPTGARGLRARWGMSVTKVCLRCGYIYLTSREATNCSCGGELAVFDNRRWWPAKPG
jgi:hypothetical protein